MVIPAGQSSVTTTVTLTPVDDNIAEDNEIARLTAKSTALTGSDGLGIVIEDNDTEPVEVVITATPDALDETAGLTPLDVTASLVGQTARQVVTVVTVITGSGTATVGEDFETASITLTVPVGEMSASGTLNLTVNDDTAHEGDETLEISGNAPGLMVTSASVTIRDDDTAPTSIGLSVTASPVTEGGGAVSLPVRATLLGGGSRVKDTIVNVAVVDLTATALDDYTAVWDTPALTIPAGQFSANTTLTLTPVQDTFDEGAETVAVRGENPDPGLPVNGVRLTIGDDDPAPTTVRLAVTPDSIYEATGVGFVDVTAILEGTSTLQEDLQINVILVRPDSRTLTTVGTLLAPLVITAGESSGTSSMLYAGLNDDVDDEDETVEVRGDSSNPDLQVVSGEVVVKDDDTAGVSIWPSSLSVEEGRRQNYTIELDSEPTSDVTVTVDLPANAGFTVNPGTITFTPQTWGPKYVYVRGNQDDDAADEAPATIAHTVISSDTLYSGATAGSVSVTITDDETAAVTISESTLGIEEGATVTYTVVLDTAPTGDVTVTIGGATDNDLALDKTSLTFTTTDWDTPQTVTVTAEQDDDAVDEPVVNLTHNVSSTVDNAYDGTIVDSVSVTVIDDDTVGVTVSPTAVTVVGGRSNEYSVVLDTEPAGDVSVTIAGLTTTDLSLDKTSLTFTTSDWSTAQTVKATALEEAAPGTVTLTHTVSSAADGEYDGVSADSVAVTILEARDEPVVQVGVTTSDQELTVAEGESKTYRIVLSSQPAGVVTVSIGGIAQTDLSLSAIPFTFTTSNWNTARTVTVTADHDDDAVDDTATLTHTVSSPDDDDYDGLSADSVTVTVTDDESVGVTISETSLSMEEGDSAAYTVVLTSEPAGDVTVAIEGITDTDLSLDNASLTFTAQNWSIPQTVIVTAEHDNDAVDEPQVTITHSVSSTDDPTYGGLNVGSIVVTVTDDDTVGVTVTPTELTIDEGASSTYTVVLDTQPTADVTVTIEGPPFPIAVDPASLIFTTQDWSTPQTVKVTAKNDLTTDGERETITHSVTGGDYSGGVSVEPVTLIVKDNDPAMYYELVTLEPVEEDVGSVRIGVVAVTIEAGVPTQVYSVSLQAVRDTADSPIDYGVFHKFSVFAPEGFEEFVDGEGETRYRQTAYVDLVIVDDEVQEETESFAVQLWYVPGFDYFPRTETQVTIIDNDFSGVIVEPTAITVTEGSTAIYTVVLVTEPYGDVTVTIIDPSNTEVTAEPGELTFTSGNWHVPQTVTVAAAHDGDDSDGATTTITHVVTSVVDSYYEGLGAESVTVAVKDDDVPAVTASFEQSSYSVDEGDTVDVTVTLNADPERTVTIPITVANQGGASDNDYSGVPASVTFNSGDTEAEITFAADSDSANDDGESVKLGFGALPAGVSAGNTDEAVVTITDDDVPSVEVSFEQGTYTVDEGSTVTIKVTLNADPERTVTIPITTTDQDGASNDDYTGVPTDVTFDSGDTEAEIIFFAASDSENDDGESVKLTFGALPLGVSEGTTKETTVSITDDGKSTVFAADASYRILTRYGATTEIVLSDYLADGVTGITFTLSSCDEWRGDYYSSAVVENQRLVLESNTLGHIHGSNTQPETVCTVTGTGGGRNQDQEFRLYTVSDRTPLPLLPGALSLVEARPSEVDIRISVPQGAQDYLRLGWREIGGQPTFRVVSGVSDGTVLTITGLEQGTEYEVRASLMTFQGFDLYRAGNSGALLSLIPDGRPDSKWIGNLASGGLGKSQTIRVTSAYSSSLSIADVRESEDVGGMIFEVTLSEASADVVTVDWTTSSDTAETPTDYQAESGTLTFPAGEIVQTLTVTINNDTVDEEEEETFTVTLTNAMNATIEDASATGTITDDDVPSVTANFEQATYTVSEGDTVDVTVTLSEDPEQSVTIPLSTANQGGASDSDYTGVPASVTFNSGETEKTFIFRAVEDNLEDGGESVKLSFRTLPDRVTAGTTDEATVNISNSIAQNSLTVTFDYSEQVLSEGGTATVIVRLSIAPGSDVTIPLTKTEQGGASSADYTGVPASVEFTSEETEQTFDFMATQNDVDDDGKSVKIGFGALLAGVSAGSTDETTMFITDDDVPSVTVSFEQGTYTVAEGSTVTVTVMLNADPERTVIIPITTTDQDGASSADYSGVPASVTFNAGDTEVEIIFTAASDSVDDDGESVKLTFGNTLPTGVSAETTVSAVVSITDDDIAGVTVHPTGVTIEEGDSAAYTVVLDTEPTGNVTVTVNAPANTDVTASPASLTFTVDGWDRPQEVTVAVTQDSDAEDDTAALTHTVASRTDTDYDGVSADSVAVTVTDDDKSTVFATVASYRILTRYGATTEIVLSDYLADGVTGITFTLSSCDGWRKDYYDSAVVEDQRLVLESNTFGHIHGSNTQPETVCTVTGTGGGRSQDQEFRLYTVSDRTPLPLSPGALSLVEARPSEVDIRISVPQGAQDYLRLGWREIGGQPTFRVVSGVSDGTVLTITGLEQGTEYDVRASLMTLQGFDLYRAGNSSAPLSLIPDGGPGSKWIGNLASGGLGKSQTIRVMSAYRSSLSIADVRESEEVGGMVGYLEVTLSEASDDVVTVDWTTSKRYRRDAYRLPGGVRYDGESVKLGFALPTGVPAGDIVQTLTVTINNDMVDEEEEETFTVTLTNAVNATIEDASATGTIIDDDVPSVEVSFEQGTYTVSEGDTVDVTVTLSEDPEQSVTIPLSTANQGGASDSDYTGVPASVTFNSGETEKTFIFRAVEDNLEDGGESVKLSFRTLPDRVTAGTTDEATVNISNSIAQNSLTVTFDYSEQVLSEGGTATVIVRLSIAPGSDVTIPLTKTEQGGASSADYTGVPASVEFTSEETEQTFDFMATQNDVDDDGKSVKIGFGALLAGVSAGSTDETTMFITDDDAPDSLTVSFKQATYTVAEGDTVDVTVTLSEDPERTVIIPLTKTEQGGASSADYSGVPASVTFNAGATAVDVTFTAASDSVDDDGESVKLTFGNTLPTGVSAETTVSAVVSITDDDIAGVTVHPTGVTIEEGDSAAYTVVLDTEPTGNVTVTVNAPANTDVTASPATLTFTVDGWDRPQEVTVAVTQDSDAEDDTAALTHTVASRTDTDYDGVSADSVAVTVTDDDKSTVFATVASYRILTRYGATTEIVLSDYLADGVTGITFTLSSCDGWRKDYYDSAVVEDERLVLESNTFGHIHGSNTQPETVCTVTGTGGGRSQDQEFRLYTVSDRTPLPLLPGALSLVEARPSEVDIRISVPQGAQDYLRLGWREIGGQPTFRVVSGVSDGTVLTITGLEQGTEYDVRASLMTLQGFDLYRAGNSGAPLSLIPDGGPGSKWIGNLASGGLGKSQTIRVMSAYRSSLSIEDVREREDVGGMVFEVTLSEASDDMVTVDWTTSNDTAETPADYQEESGTLTFAAGETVQTLTVTIINDTVDEEEEETFTVTLSNAVNAGIEDASATGTITDDDVPSVHVSFEQGTYTVDGGELGHGQGHAERRSRTHGHHTDHHHRPGRGVQRRLLRRARKRHLQRRRHRGGHQLHRLLGQR